MNDQRILTAIKPFPMISGELFKVAILAQIVGESLDGYTRGKLKRHFEFDFEIIYRDDSAIASLGHYPGSLTSFTSLPSRSNAVFETMPTLPVEGPVLRVGLMLRRKSSGLRAITRNRPSSSSKAPRTLLTRASMM